MNEIEDAELIDARTLTIAHRIVLPHQGTRGWPIESISRVPGPFPIQVVTRGKGTQHFKFGDKVLVKK